MKMLKLSTIMMGLALLGFAGCGSSDSTTGADAGLVTPDSGSLLLYKISPGDYCYKITTISDVVDGCGLLPGALVGSSLPGNYDAATGILTLGTKGSIGGGVVTYNQGTLIRTKALVTDSADPTCTWNQADTTLVTMTADNAFTAAVTENQDTIAAACKAPAATCTSTWTWTFAIDGTQSAAAGCK